MSAGGNNSHALIRYIEDSTGAAVDAGDASNNAVRVNLVAQTPSAHTPASPSYSTVGVASAQVLAANASRKGAIFVNTSGAMISFGIGVPAVLYSGITIAPYGVWEMDAFSFSLGAINAIASAAASNLGVQEWV